MKKKEDLRVIKTKRSLYNGLLELMKTKPFEEIKTKEICEISYTNRSTFYDHFTNKYELLSELIEEQKEMLDQELQNKPNCKNVKEHYMTIINLVFTHIDDNKNIYRSILQNNNNSIVIDIINESITKYVKESISKYETQNIPNDIISTFYVSAVTNICLDYLKYPNKYIKEEIISYLDKLLPDKL